MRIIEPIEIRKGMVGSGLSETDWADWASGTTYDAEDKVIVRGGDTSFVALGAGPRNWGGMCANGQIIYAAVNGGDIYVSEDGGPFAPLGQTYRSYYGMCAADSGNIYACVNNGDIYVQTAGSGAFNVIADTDRYWWGMCASGTTIYAAVNGGDLYSRVAEAGTFAALSVGNKQWTGMAACPVTGDIYACVFNGSIWRQAAGAGAFADLSETSREWVGMTADIFGNIYACTSTGQVYRRALGAGSFVSLALTSRVYASMCADSVGDVYVNVSSDGDIYKTDAAGVWRIYESLIGSNTGNYPPTDILEATPKWIEISATNKWKVFDGKVVDQMATASPAVYTITPGEAFNSVVLLNVEATSVTIATDAPAYSQTVNTGATDIVKMDLAGGVASVLTITITNTAGLAKCGEIVIGNYYELGTMKPLPVVGIVDYSVKTQDEWGDWTVVEREYSEKINAQINVAYGSVDAVVAKLKDYRATPIVWIGNSSYACTIIYGFWKDWSIPVATRGKAILSIEIMGVT